mmetsp:Transcript_47377/g.85342  ORF Transcript_47377/g.85342 Transcript_47377/m.85342 type:complete len:88 (-) Transcript_47377:764-1027(-)
MTFGGTHSQSCPNVGLGETRSSLLVLRGGLPRVASLAHGATGCPARLTGPARLTKGLGEKLEKLCLTQWQGLGGTPYSPAEPSNTLK